MKKLLLLSCIAIFAGAANAQDHSVKQDVKTGAKTVAHETKKGAKTVGNKTAELASKGASKVTDETYKDKVGPDGQTIYINGHSQYYWVDKKGHKIYVKKSQLKDK